jgi:predicted alpha-1,2-mannosidase
MKQLLFSLPIFILAHAGCQSFDNMKERSFEDEDIAAYVSPLIGTDAHGHTYPGATLPFGMVQLSPDTRLKGWDGCSGYHYTDSVVYGFSHTHLSGTGVEDYCDILFMPTTGPVFLSNGADNPDEGYASRFSHEREESKAGFYSTYLDDYDIRVELTATKRVGFHKYEFSESESGNVIVDLFHRDPVLDSWLRVVSGNEIEGFRRSSSWAEDQHVYFYAIFSQPFSGFGLAVDEVVVSGSSAEGTNVKGFFVFDHIDNKTLFVKVGISAVSAEGARRNLDAEVPHWEFEKIKTEAREAWNTELGKIRIKGGTKEQKTTFYTALYHAFLVPNLFQDVDGSFRGHDHVIHCNRELTYYTVFSLWDTFRAAHPLYTITQQQRTRDFINTMLMQFEHGGRLPVWELAANETDCMIGYHSIPVIVDAWIKGIDGFDLEHAYEAMKHSAELDHFGLAHYKKLGYIPAEEEAESVSKTLEYAYDDWCIAIMAKTLGKMDDYEKYIKRAQSYKNLFDPSTGFMRARMNGRWFEPFDPKEVNFNYTEANAWQYSFFAPQDISGLIDMLGGQDKFEVMLDRMFNESTQTTGRQQSDITGLIGQYAHGNEPSHHMAYLYNYIGKPWKTQERVRQIMNELYTHEPDGLCGNEDCGQMSAWYVFSAMGFYPVTPCDPVYVIGSPLFDEISIELENGNRFTVKVNNNSSQNSYVQSVKLNGRDHPKSFIRHQDIMNGGTLEFVMGSQPSETWGTDKINRPFSAITEHLITPVPFVVTGNRTFLTSTEISLGCTDPEAAIYFTLDETEPDLGSDVFSDPITIDQTKTLKAFAWKEGSPKSTTLIATFHKIPANRSITLNSTYANQYSAGGELALIDFIRGPHNFRTGSWQGYHGVDLEAIVDLGSIQLISSIETGFLQDIGSWIFMPLEVQYFVSNDGRSFQPVGTIINDVPEKNSGAIIKNFTLSFSAKARFIKILAKNRNTCPEWHIGAGEPAWIFADEIVIAEN